MINTSIAPLQSAISSLQSAASALQTVVGGLQTSISALQSNVALIFTKLATSEASIATDETKLAEHETRISSLENNAISDFNLPASWIASVSASLQTISVKSTKGVVSLSCSWNGLILSQQVQLRAVAHLPSKDYFAVNTCDGITFSAIAEFPPSGSRIPIDLAAFWQGKTRKVTISVLMP